MVLLQVLSLFGALAMFLYGMTIMSEGLQKSAGDRMRSLMAAMTSNPFKGVLTGTAITALIQSSSATTIMVISFVNAGLLTLKNAIGVIMGANIGTTMTAWITSFGFSVNIALFAVPLMTLGFILHSLKKETLKNVGLFVIGFSILFVGLTFMKDISDELLGSNQEQMLAFFGSFSDWGKWSILLYLLAGTILTIVLQSSSATMAITMLLATMGMIDFKLAVAMILGENIGTTITANIAATVANTSAKRAALAHTVFNVFGVIWVLLLYRPVLRTVGWIINSFIGVSPLEVDLSTGDPAHKDAMLYGIAALHTLFNLTNTFILIWFVPVIEKLVTWIIKAPKGEEEFRLQYIYAGPLSTAELSLNQASQEIIHFAKISHKGLQYAKNAINETAADMFEELNAKLIKYEEIADRVEFEIAAYLNEVSKGEISDEARREIKSMYRIIDELESMGDTGESIGRILKRKNTRGKSFDEKLLSNLNNMVDLVDIAYQAMIENLQNPELTNIANAETAEYNINEYRNLLREEHVSNIEEPDYDYITGVYYIDVVAELEKLGDYLINISEAALLKRSN